MRKILIGICAAAIIITLILTVGYVVGRKIEAEHVELSANVAEPVRFVHIGDTHFPNCFVSAKELSQTVLAQKPDCVLLTGDIVDGEATAADIANTAEFFREISSACPCFLVIGNHEIGSKELEPFIETAKSNGITVLLNEIKTQKIKNTEFAFIGLSDGYPYEEKTFKSVPSLDGKVKILLSHRPEKFPSYADSEEKIRPDIAFCGHAHGGGFRIGKAALYAPNQGLFPEYTSGLYERNGVKMIVTRGLGVSGVDFRFFNPYHLPIVTVK